MGGRRMDFARNIHLIDIRELAQIMASRATYFNLCVGMSRKGVCNT